MEHVLLTSHPMNQEHTTSMSDMMTNIFLVAHSNATSLETSPEESANQ